MQNKNAGFLWIIALVFTTFAAPVFAQNKKTVDDEIPPAEEVSIETTDGVTLKCTWYAGTNGKETVPIILVHDWGKDRRDLLPLAEHLQQAGHAVIVPDLRGHGASTKAAGVEDPLDYKEFKKGQVASLVIDIDTCKRFLMRKNNAAELNIEMLSVVATHRTAIHAVNWVVSDWAWPSLPDGTKQGQDVRALFLISPVKRFKSISLTAALKAPCMSGKTDFKPVIVSLLWGRNNDAISRDVTSIDGLISKGRIDPDEIAKDDKWDLQTNFMFPMESAGIGHELLEGQAMESVKRNIAGIIKNTLAAKSEDYPWKDRSN